MTPSNIFSMVISIISISLSLYASISTYHEKHIKTKIYLRWVHSTNKRINASFLITNLSSRPSTITNIYFQNANETAESTWSPEKLIKRITPGSDSKLAFCDSTPLNIPARSSRDFVISFMHLKTSNPSLEKMNFLFTIDGKDIHACFHPRKVLTNQELSTYIETKFH